MDDSTINSLRAALKFSPDNIPLKLHLAEVLLGAQKWEEAEKEFSELMRLTEDNAPRIGLARTFFEQGEYSKCNVIMEGMVDESNVDFNVLILYARALVREGSAADAIAVYSRALAMNPSFRDEELDGQLRLSHKAADAMIEDALDNSFIQRPDITFQDVGGMDNVKREIELKIIKPLLYFDIIRLLFKHKLIIQYHQDVIYLSLCETL